MATQIIGLVVKQQEVAPGIFYMQIKAPEIAGQAKPGQFVQVKCSNTFSPLLRRPLSLHESDPATGLISLLYQVKGPGTGLLSKFKGGEAVDLVGPLGNGFLLPPPGQTVFVVGGGMGIAPLLSLCRALQQAGSIVEGMLGFNDEKRLIRVEEYARYTRRLSVATVDGSFGVKGLVTDLLEQELKAASCHMVFACGPQAMLSEVARICEHFHVQCQVSLETAMACGTGACLGCVCKTRDGGAEVYSRVCTEGPVFDSRAVIWHA